MTEDQENRMRSQLAEYAKGELIDLAVSLQVVIDENNQEKRGLQSSNDAMAQQLPALRAQLEQYENVGVDSEELESLRQQVAMLNTRIEDLTTLNEGLQKRLIG